MVDEGTLCFSASSSVFSLSFQKPPFSIQNIYCMHTMVQSSSGERHSSPRHSPSSQETHNLIKETENRQENAQKNAIASTVSTSSDPVNKTPEL